MFKETRIEVLNVMAHLILTVLIIAGYVLLRLYGIDDETFKLVVVAAATYFFGATGQSMLTGMFAKNQPPQAVQQQQQPPAQAPAPASQSSDPAKDTGTGRP